MIDVLLAALFCVPSFRKALATFHDCLRDEKCFICLLQSRLATFAAVRLFACPADQLCVLVCDGSVEFAQQMRSHDELQRFVEQQSRQSNGESILVVRTFRRPLVATLSVFFLTLSFYRRICIFAFTAAL